MSDLTDQKLGEFQLLRHLGSGGMADVYLAQQTSLQRYVAVKVMKTSVTSVSGEELLKRFQQEATMAAGLNHPNIVQVYTVGNDGPYHYIAQEYVQGSDLSTLVKEKGNLDLGSILSVMRQVVSALKASESRRIVHRDIKPENLLVTKKGEIKVADFGLAQLGDSEATTGGTKKTMGTPLYMSPEQVSGRELDSRSDIYSFGVTCYQLLCGKPPFTGSNASEIAMQHVNNPPPPLQEMNRELPTVICRLVHRMMAKRRSLRYQTASDLLEDIRTLSAAHKQGRSLDLVRLSCLESLESLALQERRRLMEESGQASASVAVAAGLGKEDVSVGQTTVMETRQPTVSSHPPGSLEPEEEDIPVREREPVENASIDLTPAVDVTFQLLIFFMVTASFSMQKAFDVPPAKQTDGISMSVVVPDESQAAVKVQVDADNTVWIEETQTATSYREILELLTAEKARSSDIELELHPDSTHEARVMVIDAAAQAGFTRVKNKVAEW